MTVDDICNNTPFQAPEPLDPNNDCIIMVVGVGGGGGNAVGYMYNQKIKDVKFVIANTDSQAMKISPVPDRLLLGHTGLGAGDKPEVAREAAEESIEAIRELFTDKTRMVFITAGMGGGTGTGAAPIVARVAREKGILTVGIVTIPFFFEGAKKIYKALEGANEMRKYVDALLLINNERLIEVFPDLDFNSAFDKADDTLATAARSISEMITTSDVRINLDFHDVDTTLRNGGSAIISCGYGEGPNRVQNAIDDALTSPLLKNSNIASAKRLLFNLYISRTADHKFGIGEMTAFTNFVTGIEDVEVKYGVAYDDSLGDRIKLTILASGFDSEPLIPEKKAAKKDPAVADTVTPQNDAIQAIKDQYGEEKAATITAAKARNLYVVLRPDQLDNDAVIEALETYPAYSRSKEQKTAITEMTSADTVKSQPKAADTAADDSAPFVF
ncbi:MAG: cell division protein FtsZ [Bacteroides sp.]|nr:cell division protein FtsZ [Bacteroides sp.]MCM1379217.1 cell division protein FtsZ [Bacteroides sp.]MCM1445134.1 cell division protein FtsZ [Prevotella sp.]